MDRKPWLSRWSEERIGCAEPGEPDEQIVREGRLGFAPATPEEVAAAEARIGLPLPPSYREFLLTTNGWRMAGEFVTRMRTTTELGRLHDLEPLWEKHFGWCFDPEPGVADENPFTRGLLISAEADSGILFLDPGDVDESGEWAAYSMFSWQPGPPRRFPSFTALMQHLYAQFNSLHRPTGETRDSWDAAVDRARTDALAGRFDDAEAALARAEEFGRDRATVLRAQLLLFLGRHHEAQNLMGSLVDPKFTPEGFLTDPLFCGEFLPLLHTQHVNHELGNVATLLEIALMDRRPDMLRAVADHESALARSGGIPTFGNPEFDTRVRGALVDHATDPDSLWQAVLAALPHWRPRTTDHLAPVALLAHPRLAEIITPERGRELLSVPKVG
ncbi:MAG TPA: SMI1/KNR4 family protein [Nocardia sp.]|uniref:SMI1/KNR4 family protein n=1 Tax=Nocardia sp. TaxID=1821 RepID=UPI002B4B7504|nr:SMI1/KNR4 family protein [Nocardia sp.]HLS78162.1 SMI1/KNR4 family protein [Nocardia sp.]